MLEKPQLADERIVACLREEYDLTIISLDFLPLGNDSNAWAYKATTEDGHAYFVKIRRDSFYLTSVVLPIWLQEQGIKQVVTPILTRKDNYWMRRNSWARLDDFALVVYPFIEGSTGMTMGLTDAQWREYGRIMRSLHDCVLPSDFDDEDFLPEETFIPEPRRTAIMKRLIIEIETTSYDEPYARELASFWQAHRAKIERVLHHANWLGRVLQTASLPFVLCHADIHTNNVMIDQQGQLFIIDWDQPMYAPKERDLMFIVQSVIATHVTPEQEALFFEGYGQTKIDPLALAFYQCDWAIQDLGDYADRILFRDDFGEKTKLEALASFKSLFDPGELIDVALRSAEKVTYS